MFEALHFVMDMLWCGSCKLTGASSWRTPEVTQINWVTAPDIGQGPDPARSPRFGKRMRGSGSFGAGGLPGKLVL